MVNIFELNTATEEVASFYAQLLDKMHAYVKNEKFNKNYFNDWIKLDGVSHLCNAVLIVGFPQTFIDTETIK